MVQNLVCSISTTHPSNISISGSLTAMNAPTSSSRLEAITFQDIPLSALSKGSRKKLSYLMNSKKILRSEEGYERDWRGLAFLAKQKSLFDESNISNDDPMEIVLNLWCANSPTTATFAHLEKYLGVIDRWDVCDDIYDNLVEDTRTFHRKNQQIESSLDTGEFSGEVDVEFGYGTDPNILTTDDVIRAKKGLPLQRYDAFVLYADADLTYVTEMLTKLEDNTEYNFKLCIKDRDLLAGVAFKHVALTQLIEERCKYLIVILTNAFLSSAENKFFVDFTQALQIEHKTRKIIPLLYESSIDIPRTLNIYTHLRYSTSSVGFCDYWTKLANSIRNVSKVESISRTPAFGSDMHSTPVTYSRQMLTGSHVKQLPSSPVEIPSISLNGCAISTTNNDQNPKKAEHAKLRALTMRHNKSNNALSGPSSVLRNAHSTGQLNMGYEGGNSAVSMSNISATGEQKRKRKWSKLLNKVFSRSNSNLKQQTSE